MRRLIVAVGSMSVFMGPAFAQAVDYSAFVSILDPALTASFTPMTDFRLPCPFANEGTDGNLHCIGGMDIRVDKNGSANTVYLAAPSLPRPIGTDATGRGYGVTGSLQQGVRWYAVVYRDEGTGPAQGIAQLTLETSRYPNCLPDCLQFASTIPAVNLVEGTITTVVQGRFCTNDGCSQPPASPQRLTIGGLPALFDTLLTFVPTGQMFSLLTPAHPDGFRSADSLDVWSGDVQTLPGWPLAEPLACNAAMNPTPGQVVTVADTLPDPAPGQGRYYITASQHGADRRLGRQYVNGAFSARNPASLPICQ